jgi:hypothetical protein
VVRTSESSLTRASISATADDRSLPMSILIDAACTQTRTHASETRGEVRGVTRHMRQQAMVKRVG